MSEVLSVLRRDISGDYFAGSEPELNANEAVGKYNKIYKERPIDIKPGAAVHAKYWPGEIKVDKIVSVSIR